MKTGSGTISHSDPELLDRFPPFDLAKPQCEQTFLRHLASILDVFDSRAYAFREKAIHIQEQLPIGERDFNKDLKLFPEYFAFLNLEEKEEPLFLKRGYPSDVQVALEMLRQNIIKQIVKLYIDNKSHVKKNKL